MPTAIWKSRLRSGSAHCDLEVAVEVRQCPLRSGSRGWGPAVPTATWKSRLRSGSAHWDLELAVEVRPCPLGSGARGGGPAVPTGIWTARRRRRVRRRRRRTALIKSNNPHLAGGEIYGWIWNMWWNVGKMWKTKPELCCCWSFDFAIQIYRRVLKINPQAWIEKQWLITLKKW